MAKKKPQRHGAGSLYLRGPVWWMAFSNNGKRISESCKTDSKMVAQGKLTARLHEVDSGAFNPENDKLTVSDLYDMVLANYETKHYTAISSLRGRWHPEHGAGRNHQGTRTSLKSYFGHLRVSQVNFTLIMKYQQIRQQEGASDGSINRELSVLRRGFRIAYKAEKIKRIPPFPEFFEEQSRKGSITDEHYLKFVDATSKVGGLWLRTMFEAAYLWGTRKGELLNLLVRNVNMQDRTITLENTKNGEDRVLPMEEPTIISLIGACIQNKRPDEHVFTRANGKPVRDFFVAWKRVCRMAGIPNLLFHDLRRSALTNLIDAGISDKAVMEISGHKSVAVFHKYVRGAEKRKKATMQVMAQRRAERFGELLQKHYGAPEPHPQPTEDKMVPN